MLLVPRKRRYQKIHRTQLKRLNRVRSALIFQKHIYHVINTVSTSLTAKQMEATRKSIARRLKLYSKFFFYVFPDLPFTTKSSGMRMGNGKGELKDWRCKVKAGTPLLKIKQSNLKVFKILKKIKLNKFNFQVRLR